MPSAQSASLVSVCAPSRVRAPSASSVFPVLDAASISSLSDHEAIYISGVSSLAFFAAASASS